MSASPVRHSTARAPWATWGSMTSGSSRSVMCPDSPSRSNAVAATTMASTSAARARRVAMLPRRPSKRRSGRTWASWARRRSDPVATVAPSGRPSSVVPTRASRTSPRSGVAPITSPDGVVEGRSLAEWTATSARPSRTAAWTSLANTPLPPSSQMGTSRRRSPFVSTRTISASSPGSAFCSRATTRSACHRARAEPRVATRSRTVSLPRRRGRARRARRPSRLDLEQLAQGGHEAVATGAAGGILQHDAGPVQQLGHEAPGHGVDQGGLALVERADAVAQALDLGGPHTLGGLAQRHDHRRDLAGGGGPEVALELLVEDVLDAGHLAPPLREPDGGEGSQVVHVEQGDAVDLAHGGIDVARH